MAISMPSSENPRDLARSLSEKKKNIETEIEAQITILKANGNSTMQTPLVDAEGFPRADIDIYAVRGARVKIIELRNDLAAVTNELSNVLQMAFAPSATTVDEEPTEVPFAKVDGVSPGSPASEAGLQRDDLIVKFGSISASTVGSSLQGVAQVVAEYENRGVVLKIMREQKPIFFTLTPRKGWGGRGMLGCHIVPYKP
ncbi:proteasome 26S subunit [Cylindrobasidium torrendii FP15055 ss-10]|uniref:Probable 26S proteasome regulatory subunit p27 n=1 Tax=Cylindrobasidium torrendii FP15055 ss-10 TaxID=1314674 RepID=A0A0D7BFR6_9AGAR|nr:proteasome 26S subunit [Cylindrobasidium torrendii FP15055 ss-10]